ncbi:MAG: outer membrane protein assembly factor BamD [Cytophagales bacterium]|nr:MAG: outer membrane protein assembly factor BamD [Cytophagales bacterium]
MKGVFYVYLFLGLFISIACSKFNKLVKSADSNKKLEAAINFYEKKDYYKAATLLDEIVPLLKGKQEGETAQYYQAMTYYADKQYIMSGYHFKEFYEAYPRSDKAEQCYFLYAKSLYQDSPQYNLDQQNTNAALTGIQAFANKFPESKFMPEANKISEELNKKIEYKDYQNTKLYYKIRNYKSAVVSLGNFLSKYPSSVYHEEIMYLKFKSQFDLARKSVDGKKKKDRYIDAMEFYLDFVDKHPNSKLKKDAENHYIQCEKEVKKIDSTNKI